MQMAVLAMDTIGHLPITSKSNRWALMAICVHSSYIFAVSMKEKSAEDIVQAYLPNIPTHNGKSMAILSNYGKEFKNKMLTEVCDQLGIKRLFTDPFHPQGNANP